MYGQLTVEEHSNNRQLSVSLCKEIFSNIKPNQGEHVSSPVSLYDI